MSDRDISQRKADHLDLCASDRVSARRRSTLLECVQLEHQALPELSLEEVDPRAELFGKRLRAPLLLAGMTGGHERAAEVNRALAAVAERGGYAFGLGSQRAMLREPSLAWTYRVREVAPSVPILGNLGLVQARELPTDRLRELLAEVGADAVCLHMNPAMELVQPGGDRDFRGGVETLRRLVHELGLPVVAKETGCGIGSAAARRIRDAGVRWVDVSGAGGTSWVGVEALRAEGGAARLGELLWDWGVPTAASVLCARAEGLRVVATGGIRTGLDVARAVALGAEVVGIARPLLQAFFEGGERGAEAFLREVEGQLRAVMLLTGSRTLEDLRAAPRMLAGELGSWAARLTEDGSGAVGARGC